jgi:hypothetical protein
MLVTSLIGIQSACDKARIWDWLWLADGYFVVLPRSRSPVCGRGSCPTKIMTRSRHHLSMERRPMLSRRISKGSAAWIRSVYMAGWRQGKSRWTLDEGNEWRPLSPIFTHHHYFPTVSYSQYEGKFPKDYVTVIALRSVYDGEWQRGKYIMTWGPAREGLWENDKPIRDKDIQNNPRNDGTNDNGSSGSNSGNISHQSGTTKTLLNCWKEQRRPSPTKLFFVRTSPLYR